MVFFLLTSPILAGAFSWLLLTPRFDGIADLTMTDTRERSVRNPALLALAWSILTVAFQYAYLTWAPWVYSPIGLYLYYLFRDHLTMTFLIAAGSFIAARPVRDESPAELYVAHLTFTVVACLVLAVVEAISGGTWVGLYRAALLPLLRLALVVLLPVAMTHADTARGGGWAVVAIALYPFLAALPASLSEWLRPIAAFLTSGAVALCAGAAVLVLLRGRGGVPFRSSVR